MKIIPIIHIAKKEFGLGDEDFRDVLERVTGKRSLKEMSEKERIAVVDDFKAKGFVVKRGKGRAGSNGGKSGISAKAYVRLIHALWGSCAKLGVIDDGSPKALRSFVATKTEAKGKRVDDPEFLTYDEASPIIEALKSMEPVGRRDHPNDLRNARWHCPYCFRIGLSLGKAGNLPSGRSRSIRGSMERPPPKRYININARDWLWRSRP